MTRMDLTNTAGSAIAGFVRTATLAPESASGIAGSGIWSLIRAAGSLPLALARALAVAEERRMAAASLRQMDDHLLADIGLSRQDIGLAVKGRNFRHDD